jgi:hypothetical protein
LAGSGLTVLVAYVFAGWMVQSVANYIIGAFVWVFAAAAINYCRRILHALAAISDYLSRESIRLESDYLTKLFDVLVNALEDLPASLQMGTGPRRFPDLSEFSQRLEKALRAVPLEMEEAANLAVENPKNNEAQVWLFYHLKNVSHLTLAVREVLSRRNRFGFPQEKRKSPQALTRTRMPSPVMILLKQDAAQPDRATVKNLKLKRSLWIYHFFANGPLSLLERFSWSML